MNININDEMLKRFVACLKILYELDFDHIAYSVSSLKKIKNDLLNILIGGYNV